MDFEAFPKYSLGVRNRQEIRIARALENQLEAAFYEWAIRYAAEVKTETGERTDFILPGTAEYFDPRFLISMLTMLVAKSSCKEHRSQILSEIDRVGGEHLVTREHDYHWTCSLLGRI